MNEGDIVFLGLELEEIDGLEVLRRVSSEIEGLRVVAIASRISGAGIMHLLSLGANGCICLEDETQDFVDGAYEVAHGRRFVSSSFTHALATHLSYPIRHARRSGDSLSVREYQVLRGIAEGRTRSELAATLSIGPATVSKYRQRAAEKLGLKTDAQLTVYMLADTSETERPRTGT